MFFVFLHMIVRTLIIFFFLLCYVSVAQEVSLPADLRQHALTQYNASLFNPTFVLDRNNPQSVSFWTRWQWQQVDTDPTTLFLNYSRRINEKSGVGAGFFQHNTGIYFNTGGVVNYAYEVRLNPIIKLSVGANLFGFQQQLADTRFIPDPDVLPVPLDVSDDFILQLAPGINLSVENFSLSVASENLFDYNVTDKGANTETADKIFMGMVSYDFPVIASDSTAFLRPSIYLRTIPEQENQIGLNTLFSTKRYWAQAGYNNFYGISVGAGGTVFNRFSLGALMEFGTGSSLNSKDASFEIIASFFLGNPQNRREPVVNVFDVLDKDVVVGDEEEEAAKMQEELENAQKIASEETTKEKEALGETPIEEEETPLMAEEPQVNKKEARRIAAQERALAKERRKDSLDQIKKNKEALALQQKEEKQNAKLAEEEAKIAVAAEKKKREDALAAAEEAKKKEILDDEETRANEAAEELKRAEALAETTRLKVQKEKDSLAQVKKMEAIAAAEELKTQKLQDSIRQAKETQLVEAEVAKEEVKEEIKPRAGEKYEEVITEDGLEAGFYLIANVFGTKKYFDAFMQDLRKKGIEPGSFVRSRNNYNYAYLKRYNTISEARRARDNKFDGKYQGNTWIFRVVGE